MQLTPENNTWSAILKASAKVVFSLATRNRFWFGMTIRVSTFRHLEGVGEGRLLVGDAEKILVRNDDQGIDMPVQLVDAVVREPHAPVALKREGLGHNANRQDALLACRPGNDGSRPRASAAAHARSDEHHVRTAQVVVDLVEAFLSGGTTDFGMRARAQPLGHRDPELDDSLRLAQCQCLRIGVGADEVDPVQSLHNHVVDGVSAGAADTEHGDAGLQFLDIRDGKIDRHVRPHGTGGMG